MTRVVVASVAMLLASSGFPFVQEGKAQSPVGEPAVTSAEQDPTTEAAPASPIVADVPAVTVPARCEEATGSGVVAAIPEGGSMPEGMAEHSREMVAAATQLHGQLVGSMMAEDPDLAFACAMITQHQTAINVSGVEITRGEDDALRQIAREMIETHRREIEELSRWVAENAP